MPPGGEGTERAGVTGTGEAGRYRISGARASGSRPPGYLARSSSPPSGPPRSTAGAAPRRPPPPHGGACPRMARTTQTTYRGQWQHFRHWAPRASGRCRPRRPRWPGTWPSGWRRAAISPPPCGWPPPPSRSSTRPPGWRTPVPARPCSGRCGARPARWGRSQKQAAALTTEALAVIQSTASSPPAGTGRREESPETANYRGNLDIAVIRLMRDAMLRVSEAAGLTGRTS